MTAPEWQPVRVSIADNHKMFVEAIKLILDTNPAVNVVSLATNGDDLLRDIQTHTPDVSLVDISMPGPGFQAIASSSVLKDSPTRLVALKMHCDGDLAQRVIAAGFHGFVVKDSASSELVASIQNVALGHVFISNAVPQPGAIGIPLEERLTARELECVRLAGQGQSNRQICQQLGVSERTIKFHFENIFRKLGVKSRGEAAAFARRSHII